MTLYKDPNFPSVYTVDPENLRAIDRELLSVLSNLSFNLKSILDGGISLADNVDAVVVSFTSNGSSDTEDTVGHTLGKIPLYFIVCDINKGGVVYRSGTAFTKTNVYLKTSVTSAAVKVLLL